MKTSKRQRPVRSPERWEGSLPATEGEGFLPSGLGLIELALQAGFVAPVLLGEEHPADGAGLEPLAARQGGAQ